MPDDRPYQGRPSSDRPQFAGPRQNFSGPRPAFQPDNRPPFRPAPRVEVPAAPMIHSLKLRDGDREIEVSGSAAFVRQVLDDLPAMWARLHGEGSSRPGRIDLPSPRPHEQAATREAAATQAVAEPVIAPVREPATNGKHAVSAAVTNGKRPAERGTPDDKVLAVLKSSTRPLAVAAIRKRLGGSFTPQQVRRILERNAPKVSVTDDRPATYRLR
jgi:hypothetical protein